MNVEIGTEVAQFRAEKQYINGIFVAVCGLPSLAIGLYHPWRASLAAAAGGGGGQCGIIPFTNKSDGGWIKKKSIITVLHCNTHHLSPSPTPLLSH